MHYKVLTKLRNGEEKKGKIQYSLVPSLLSIFVNHQYRTTMWRRVKSSPLLGQFHVLTFFIRALLSIKEASGGWCEEKWDSERPHSSVPSLAKMLTNLSSARRGRWYDEELSHPLYEINCTADFCYSCAFNIVLKKVLEGEAKKCMRPYPFLYDPILLILVDH